MECLCTQTGPQLKLCRRYWVLPPQQESNEICHPSHWQMRSVSRSTGKQNQSTARLPAWPSEVSISCLQCFYYRTKIEFCWITHSWPAWYVFLTIAKKSRFPGSIADSDLATRRMVWARTWWLSMRITWIASTSGVSWSSTRWQCQSLGCLWTLWYPAGPYR